MQNIIDPADLFFFSFFLPQEAYQEETMTQ